MLKDNYTDEELGFEVRRALLSDDPVPEAGEAFAEFCERNGLAAPGVDPSAVVSHRHRSFRLLADGSRGSSCCRVIFRVYSSPSALKEQRGCFSPLTGYDGTCSCASTAGGGQSSLCIGGGTGERESLFLGTGRSDIFYERHGVYRRLR